MPNARDVTVNTEWLKVMSVGESGTGKSSFAASFPTPGFVFDFGKEILSYRGKDFDYEQYELDNGYDPILGEYVDELTRQETEPWIEWFESLEILEDISDTD